MKNMQNINNTQYFRVEKEPELKVGDVLTIVYRALSEKGYNPVNQIVGLWRGSKRLSQNIRWSVLFWVIRKI